MNIQNITALAAQLKDIGFDNMGCALLKRICLSPQNFSITERLLKAPESVSLIFHFEKDEKTKSYKLVYYDAVMQSEFSIENINVEVIDVKDIDERMSQLDWKDVFDFSKQKLFSQDDKASYENELKVSQVIESLNKLEISEEGKQFAMALKQKYWSEIPYIDIMGTITNGKSKSEISQRFYIAEGQPIISADEAYRFLLNRLMEKRMQSKKKQENNAEESATEESGKASGSGLLKKKRIGSSRRNKQAQV